MLRDEELKVYDRNFPFLITRSLITKSLKNSLMIKQSWSSTIGEMIKSIKQSEKVTAKLVVF